MGNRDEKRKGVGRPKVKEKRKARSIKATEEEWQRILKLLKKIKSPKAVALILALESYQCLCSSEKATDLSEGNPHSDGQSMGLGLDSEIGG